jgi:hypothetical protein
VHATIADHLDLGIPSRTHHRGRLAFNIPTSGMWVLITMEKLLAAKDFGADWESVWDSITFEVVGEKSATAH